MNLLPARWYLMLVMPSTAGLSLVILGLALAVRRARKGGGWAALRAPLLVSAGGALLLYVCATPWLATMLSRSLERMTPYVEPDRAPTADAIVVLGGGQSGYLAEDGTMRLQGGRGTNRLDQGVKAFKAGKASVLVVGGGAFGLPGDPMVGDYLLHEAIARGVPPEAVLACGPATYTTDEAEAIAALLRPRGVHRILLCTSATHLPRASITYRRLGFEVIAIPCDFDTRGQAEAFSPLMLLPRGQALFQTENCLKEWMGLTAAWLQPAR